MGTARITELINANKRSYQEKHKRNVNEGNDTNRHVSTHINMFNAVIKTP